MIIRMGTPMTIPMTTGTTITLIPMQITPTDLTA